MRLMTRDRSFYKSLVTLAIPVALQNLITFSVTMADNLMVSSLGDTAVSGVYMGSQMMTMLQMVSWGIEGAIVVLSTQYWGEKDKKSIKLIASIGLHFAAIFGFMFLLAGRLIPVTFVKLFTRDEAVVSAGVEYMKTVCYSYIFFCLTQAMMSTMHSVENTRIGMTVSLISLVTNICLNYILIYGKLGFEAMGIRGAAIATVISRAVETGVMAYYMFIKDKTLDMGFKDALSTNKVLRKDLIKCGLPILGGQVVWGINTLACSAILGRIPDTGAVVTATSISGTMRSLVFVTLKGTSSAVGIITGKTVGEGKYELMKEYARTVQILFLIIGLVSCGLVNLLKMPFIGLYREISPEAVEYAKQFITILSFTIIGTSYQGMCLTCLVKAGGDLNFVFINDTIFIFGLVLPSAIISLRLGAPAWVIYCCLKCDEVLKCAVAVVKINRFKWMKKLTRENTELNA